MPCVTLLLPPGIKSLKIKDTKFANIFLMKYCWMLQNARVTAFTVSELVRENQEGCVGRGEGKISPHRD